MSKVSLKRVLPLFAGVGLVAASASSVVSCTAPVYAAGVDGQRVVVVTDGGHVNDHSFNQDAYIGVKNFVNNAYVEMKPDPKNSGEYIKSDTRLNGKDNYVEAGGTDTTSIVNGYGLAVVKKANVIVTPGFAHVNTLGMALPFLHKHNVNVVLVDGLLKDDSVISIQFNSQISGVMAGFDTSYLMGTTYRKTNSDKKYITTSNRAEADKDGNGNPILYYDVNHDGHIKIGTFAGASNKYGVDNYMWGLLLGMELYNEVREIGHHTDWAISESANNNAGKGNTGKIIDVQTNGDQDPNWYTNSFALGDATKSGIVSTLVDKNKADVIFPVAGPQIQDVLAYQPKSGDKPYVIGVDVDQAAEYTDAHGRFITSAIKNIDTAVPEALYRASHEGKNDNTLKDFGTIQDDGKKYGNFDTKDHWLGTAVNPFVNWSIDFTDTSVPEKENQGKGNYQLKKNYIKMYNDENVMVSAPENSAMKLINDFFRGLGGANPHADDYMNGNLIVKIANEVIEKYAPTGMTGELLDLSKAPVADKKAGDK